MKTMKKGVVPSIIRMTTLVVLALFYSCASNVEEVLLEEGKLPSPENPISEGEQETIDALYDHLSQQDNISEMSIKEEFAAMQEYAQEVTMDFDIQRAIDSYNDGLNAKATDFDPDRMAILKQIDNIFITHGFTSKAKEELKRVRQSVETKIATGDANSDLLEHIRSYEYLTESKAFSNYLGAKYGSTTMQQRGPLKCTLYIIQLSYYLAKCASGQDYLACVQVTYYTALIAAECPGSSGDYEDPCLNSPDPCCGVHCRQGLYCINGDCVLDPDDPGCAQEPCPPGYICDGYNCIAL